MEDPRQVPALVHVLRHSFRPSDQLEKALENFLPPESKQPSSSFEIKSLSMLALDGYLHANHAYTIKLMEARKAVNTSKGRSLEIIPDIEIRNVNENTIDILMGVQSKLAMYAITRTTANLLKNEAIAVRDEADPKFSVFARINSTVPITVDFQEQALEQYSQVYQQLGPKHLMNILPEGISGKDQYVRVRRAGVNDSY